MINKRRVSDESQRGASRVLTPRVKISATSADMRTGFCSLGAQNALQSESSSSRQPQFAMGASPIKNQSQSQRGASRVLTRCVKISATSADMRTGFRFERNTLQSESSSSRQPRFARGAIPIKNQSPRGLPLGLSGAATRIRTGDLILTKDVLYQLSHSSILQG